MMNDLSKKAGLLAFTDVFDITLSRPLPFSSIKVRVDPTTKESVKSFFGKFGADLPRPGMDLARGF
jgi:hypothetical protein